MLADKRLAVPPYSTLHGRTSGVKAWVWKEDALVSQHQGTGLLMQSLHRAGARAQRCGRVLCAEDGAQPRGRERLHLPALLPHKSMQGRAARRAACLLLAHLGACLFRRAVAGRVALVAAYLAGPPGARLSAG